MLSVLLQKGPALWKVGEVPEVPQGHPGLEDLQGQLVQEPSPQFLTQPCRVSPPLETNVREY